MPRAQPRNNEHAGKPVATKHKGQSSPQSNLDYVSKRSLSWRVSKIVTKMLERLIGLLCYLCSAEISNKSARRWSNEEFTYVPSKVTLEEQS